MKQNDQYFKHFWSIDDNVVTSGSYKTTYSQLIDPNKPEDRD